MRDAIAARIARDSSATADPVERALRRFYDRRDRRPAWSDGRRTSDDALACVESAA